MAGQQLPNPPPGFPLLLLTLQWPGSVCFTVLSSCLPVSSLAGYQTAVLHSRWAQPSSMVPLCPAGHIRRYCCTLRSESTLMVAKIRKGKIWVTYLHTQYSQQAFQKIAWFQFSPSLKQDCKPLCKYHFLGTSGALCRFPVLWHKSCYSKD